MSSAQVYRLATTYAAFLNYAFDRTKSRFRNFHGFRPALAGGGRLGGLATAEHSGCSGLALAGRSGATFNYGPPSSLTWHCRRSTKPPRRGLGVQLDWCLSVSPAVQRCPAGQPGARHLDRTADRVLDKTATEDWPWFEDSLNYDNAKLPHALIASGRSGGNPRALELGLKTLRWLVDQQKSPTGFFRPIGSDGFHHRDRERAQFDQQPLEANATVSACIEAYHATDDQAWLQEARVAFEWFMGANDLGLDLYDAKSGGCCDGLQEDRVNLNQGAESTLAFLLALGEMKLLESTLATSRQLQVN